MSSIPTFIVDAMFGRRVVELLRGLGAETFHVQRLGGLGAKDETIWAFTEERQAILLTRDRDFLAFQSTFSTARILLHDRFNQTLDPMLEELTLKIPIALKEFEKGITLVRTSLIRVR